MKHILLATTGLSSVGQGGGISSYVHDLAENLVHQGYTVTVFLIHQSKYAGICTEIHYNYRFFQIPQKRCDEKNIVDEICNAILSIKPDIIINNDTSYIAGLWPVLDPSIIRISVMHGFIDTFTWTNSGIQGKMSVYNWPYIDYIVFQNETMLRRAAVKYGLPSSKLKCIHQTVALPLNLERKSHRDFSLVFAGGEAISKGAKDMFRIARKLKDTSLDFKLYWCLPALKYERYFRGDSRFVFLGRLSRERFLETMSVADCMIIPTHMDTGPLLLVEALALGVVPICNNLQLSSIPDLVKESVTGFKVDGNTDDYMKAILDLKKNTKAFELSNRCMNFFNQELSPKSQVEKYESLFQKEGKRIAPAPFSNKNIIHFHNWNTAVFPIYSLKRIIPKILNAFEIVMDDHVYNRWIKYLKL